MHCEPDQVDADGGGAPAATPEVPAAPETPATLATAADGGAGTAAPAAPQDTGATAAVPATPAAEPGVSPAECGARLAEMFPALFAPPGAPGPVKPIKLRIHADIQARAPGLFSKRVLGVFFSRYTTSNAYLKSLAAPGAQRFDLDGQPAGEIAEEHRAAAAEELARRHAIAAERRAAQRPQRPPPDDRRPRTDMPRPDARAARPPRGDRREGDARRGRPEPRDAISPGPPSHAQRRPTHRNERRPSPRPAPDRAPAAALPAAALPADPARRERALLLRAYESSTLSKANFCALKRITEAELDAALAQARAERG